MAPHTRIPLVSHILHVSRIYYCLVGVLEQVNVEAVGIPAIAGELSTFLFSSPFVLAPMFFFSLLVEIQIQASAPPQCCTGIDAIRCEFKMC